jgi:cell division protein FtsQ
MKNINWNNIRLVVILCMVVFLYAFTGKRNEGRKLIKTDIELVGNENYITKDSVNNLLIQSYGAVASIHKVDLDLNSVEKRLNSNAMVEKAEVYTTVDGKLKAIIKQRKPVARIFEGSQSYYLDSRGQKMPLSDNETARVPLVTGNIEVADAKKMQQLLDYIYKDAFLNKNIIGLSVTPVGNMILKSRGDDYDIVFGKPINIERKFENYKAFLQDAAKDTLIKNYKTVNLKFTQQVVCTKK